ncbi:MAG: TIGR03790 family protein [Deltaproteobacteria bacterium]|nr:TIGR03790 family protein [Deltaproteobacteria bacterium]
MSILCFIFITVVSTLFPMTGPAYGLTAEEIAVIANKQEEDSINLARFYMDCRGIPAKNLITRDIDPAEECQRSDYDSLIAAPVRSFLHKHSPAGNIRCLVTMYGVPLKITAPAFSAVGSDIIAALRKKIEDSGKSSQQHEEETELSDHGGGRVAEIKKEIAHYTQIHDMRASVDSELSLVLQPHPLAYWIDNPYNRDLDPDLITYNKKDVIMVSRLDASSADLVKKIITTSLFAEKEGLRGSAFFDARWPDPGIKEVSGYAWYDRAIHRAAAVVRQSGKADKVVVDEESRLFPPGSMHHAALYCGWYSLAKYIDAFDWQNGAVGYHIASSECSTLKKEGSQVWCKRMLEKGVCATMGPVGEPYVNAFPPPDLFFSFLTGGKNLVESYYFSLPYLSWKMVLIGDPLYTPFAAAPR